MIPPWEHSFVMNWSMTQRSPCYVSRARDIAGITQTLTAARREGLSVIAHGAGHSYTDAALNTDGVVVDLTGMRRILSWDREQGIMQVEPGVTLRDVVRAALPDRWWPPVTPSSVDATIGGCAALNVNGKNAWKCGSFGEHLLSLNVLLANGQVLTISPDRDPQLFHAVVGSAGLLGIITSITMQLERVPSTQVDVRVRPASCLGEILTIFQQEQSADFLEAWVDGFASGRQLGRGFVISTKYSRLRGEELSSRERGAGQLQARRIPDRLEEIFFRTIGLIGRQAVNTSVRTANGAAYWWTKLWDSQVIRQRSLFESTFYTPAAFLGYRSLIPQGAETFQAFVPRTRAEDLFSEILRRSQENHFMPLWCVIKQHRRDPFLFSYQVDGFSLELNYRITPQTVQGLHQMLRELMDLVIAAGGRFYLAKDSLLTNALYRQSVGDAAVEAFLDLKRLYDPEMLFQSNLFRRVFQAVV